MSFVEAAKCVKNAQTQVEDILKDLEHSGLRWYSEKDRDYSAWRVMGTDEHTTIIGPQTWNVSAHLKLEIETAQLAIHAILTEMKNHLRTLGGYFTTPLSMGFERRYNGMVFYFMNFAIKGCLDGDDPKKWVLPKVLERIHPVPTGTGTFKLGHHTFLADRPESIIKLYLILSAPKTDPKTRKKTKDMPQINQVWDFETVKAKQQAILDEWKRQ